MVLKSTEGWWPVAVTRKPNGRCQPDSFRFVAVSTWVALGLATLTYTQANESGATKKRRPDSLIQNQCPRSEGSLFWRPRCELSPVHTNQHDARLNGSATIQEWNMLW